MTRSWYVYKGSGDPTLFSNYRKTSLKHSCLCGNQICAIYARDVNTQSESPLSINLQQYIKEALTSGALQPDTPRGSRKYVYLKYKEL